MSVAGRRGPSRTDRRIACRTAGVQVSLSRYGYGDVRIDVRRARRSINVRLSSDLVAYCGMLRAALLGYLLRCPASRNDSMRSALGRPGSGGSRDDLQERRAQIYALNRHMMAFEEKRWQCCVAGKQPHVDAISKCVDVFSRRAPCPPQRAAPPHTRVAERHTTRSSLAPQGDPAVGPAALVGARDGAGAHTAQRG